MRYHCHGMYGEGFILIRKQRLKHGQGFQLREVGDVQAVILVDETQKPRPHLTSQPKQVHGLVAETHQQR